MVEKSSTEGEERRKEGDEIAFLPNRSSQGEPHDGQMEKGGMKPLRDAEKEWAGEEEGGRRMA
jgi:hypothetical protein